MFRGLILFRGPNAVRVGLGCQKRFKQRGVDASRIGKLLDGKAECRCTRSTCFQKLSQDQDGIQDFLARFHDLAKLDQDDFESFLFQEAVVPEAFTVCSRGAVVDL